MRRRKVRSSSAPFKRFQCLLLNFSVDLSTMGPKAKPAGKKKEGNPENGGELTAEEKAKLFMLTCQSLQVQLCKCHISKR